MVSVWLTLGAGGGGRRRRGEWSGGRRREEEKGEERKRKAKRGREIKEEGERTNLKHPTQPIHKLPLAHPRLLRRLLDLEPVLVRADEEPTRDVK
jgi:hypothetical protein